MTTPETLLSLHDVGCQLPDGRWLFEDLNAHLGRQRTGLVGRNGVGKSVLARLLAGMLAPTRGHIERRGRVHYLAQQLAADGSATVASLAGLQTALDALRRIEAGSSNPADFDAIGERWNLRGRLRDELVAAGLGHLHADTRASQLSGGEHSAVALLGARLADADLLILDEPSNHLDRRRRAALREQLQSWSGGLLVISHDRVLLEAMESIVELSAQGLRRYGGGYSFYAEASVAERAQAQAELESRRNERRRGERLLVEQRERQARREARGRREGAGANEPALSLGLRKRRAEQTDGRRQQQQAEQRAALAERVAAAAARISEASAPVLFAPQGLDAHGERVAELRGVVLPHLQGPAAHVDLLLRGGQRIALLGDNGSGKSTLLKVLAGELKPLAGECVLHGPAAYLDQTLSILDSRPLIEQLRDAHPRAGEATQRTRLALLGLDAPQVEQPASLLSGGERMKAALAMVLYAEQPARLLLLDEPDNHLDLAAQDALVAMLDQYAGTLVIVSHDDAFLERLLLDARVLKVERGWVLDSA